MKKRGHSSTARLLLATAGLSTLAVIAVPSLSQAGATTPKYYLSLGDSYSVGYQPQPSPGGATSGYTAVVAKKLKMTLVNYGCGGATTSSLLNFTGVCGVTDFGPPAATNAGAIPSGDSQIQAADAFITAHPGQIGLITVSIGGNDVTPCAAASPTNPVNGQTSPVPCVSAGVAAITSNVKTAVDDLHAAAGSSVPIVGLTYPDVLLGLDVFPTYPPSSSNLNLVKESTLAFSALINPALKGAYTSVPDGKFVDVTAATGAYTPLTTLAKLPASAHVTDVPAGTKLPKAVVDVCKLTWYCQLGNIHANTKGYKEIGKLITKAA